MKRFLLFLSVLFAIGIMAKAETATVNFKSVFGNSTLQTIADKITPVQNTQDGEIAKITYQKNESTNAPAYNKDGSMRLYKPDLNNGKTEGCSMTITPAGNITITEVSFTFSSATYAFTSNSVTEGTYADSKWTGNVTSALTFTNRGTEHVRIKSLIVTYIKATGPVDYTPTFQAEYDFPAGCADMEFAIEGEHPEFTFASNAEGVAKITKVADYYSITTGEEGQATITATWDKSEKWNASSAENPVTFKVNVAKQVYTHEFKNMILEEGTSEVIDFGANVPETNFTVTSENPTVATVTYADGKYTVSAIAVGTTKINVSWGDTKWADGKTSFDVTVSKKLVAPELSFDKAEITEYIGSLEQDLPVLTATEGLKITYSSSNEAVATVNPETGAVSLVAAGSTTITATSEATAEYKAGSDSYVLNVKAAPTGGYALLTNIDDLVDGTVGVIVAKTDAENNLGKGMGSFSNKGFTLADVTFEGNNVNITEGVTEFTFNKNGESYNIVSGESYLGATSDTSTDLTFGTKATSSSDIAKQNATITVDDKANAKIVFMNSAKRQLACRTGNINLFKFYGSNNINESEYFSVQIYVAQPAAEVEVPAMIVDDVENAEPVIVFHEGMTIHFNIPEGVRVYRRFVATEEPATPAPARVTGEDGNEYERHTEAYTVPGYGTLSYFAESQGVRSAVKNVRVSDTTGVEDITVGAEEGEAVYYDMTGRRVANPTTGLYIRVNGSTATKVYLR